MTTTIKDVSGERRLTFEGTNPLTPSSVFVTGPQGLVIEFDRVTFLEGLRREFGLIDVLEAMLAVPSAALDRPPVHSNPHACLCAMHR